MANNAQEITTTALRTEAAKALSDASYEIRFRDAGIAEVRELIDRAIQALEMSLPDARSNLIAHRTSR